MGQVIIRGTGRIHPPLVTNEETLTLHPHRRRNGELLPTEKAAAFVESKLGFVSHAVGYDMKEDHMPPEWLDSAMQLQAAQKALEIANWKANQIDLLVTMTSTPDFIRFPYSVGTLARELGCHDNSYLLNIDEGCGGVAYHLPTIQMLMKSGYRRALIVASNCYSAFMALQDEEYCIASNLNVSVFGDGAGAIALELVETDGEIGLLSCCRVANSDEVPMNFKVGGCAQPISPNISRIESQYWMYGATVTKVAPVLMAQAYQKLQQMHPFDLKDIDMVIPHQANPAAVETGLTKPLGIPTDKVWLGGKKVGNLAVGCLPFGIDECLSEGRLALGSGQLVVMVAIGAGGAAWTGGASLWRI